MFRMTKIQELTMPPTNMASATTSKARGAAPGIGVAAPSQVKRAAVASTG